MIIKILIVADLFKGSATSYIATEAIDSSSRAMRMIKKGMKL